MSEGDVHHDHALSADGLARGQRAIDAWPEFNMFTVGYALSARRDTSSLFRHGLDLQWRNMDLCTRTVIDRANPRTELAVAAESTETDARRRRACWNTAIAPHNAEGFFLNMGDMLVKSGDWRIIRSLRRVNHPGELDPGRTHAGRDRHELEAGFRRIEISHAMPGKGSSVVQLGVPDKPIVTPDAVRHR